MSLRCTLLCRAGRTAVTALTLAAALSGCVTEKPKPKPAGITYSEPRPPDTSALETYVPRGLSSSSSVVSAAIGPIGSIEYDGYLIPLISPAGEYVAVQAGDPAPTWKEILADPAADPTLSLDVIIYRIEKVDGGPRQRIVEQRRLDGVGIIGRSADETGFLIESPQPDGSRRIGWVHWRTGEVDWLLRTGVNAFATRSPSGRLAWCERVGGGSARFELLVQGNNEVYRAGDGEGSWLLPVWCANESVLFAFNLMPTGELDLVVFDTRSAASMRQPLQRERLTNSGKLDTAFQALAGIPSPAAPDGSPRLLFFHTGQERVFEYDARSPEGRRVRGLPSPSLAAAWHTGDGIVYAGRRAIYYQFLRERSAPVELLKGFSVPRMTSNPMHPFVLVAVDQNVPFQLNLWAMGIVDEETVRAAAEQVDARSLNNSRR